MATRIGWVPIFSRKVQYIRELRRLIISVMATLKSVCLERRGVSWWSWSVDALLVLGGARSAVSYEDETLVFSRCFFGGMKHFLPSYGGDEMSEKP